MTTEQLAKSIRAYLEAVIAAAGVATEGPWKHYTNQMGTIFVESKKGCGICSTVDVPGRAVRENFHFIADSRTTSPQMARALLLVMDGMDEWNRGDGYSPRAELLIRDIARELGIETSDGATLDPPPAGAETAEPIGRG